LAADCHPPLRLRTSLSPILQVLSVKVLEQVLLTELVVRTGVQNETLDIRNQLMLNGF
jgi:hypothetical protein